MRDPGNEVGPRYGVLRSSAVTSVAISFPGSERLNNATPGVTTQEMNRSTVEQTLHTFAALKKNSEK